MIKLKDAYGDTIEVSTTSGGEVRVEDTFETSLKFTPPQARELAAALIECANEIQRKGGE